MDALVDHYVDGPQIDTICAIEARGFLFAAPMAYRMGTGVVPIRKPGMAGTVGSGLTRLPQPGQVRTWDSSGLKHFGQFIGVSPLMMRAAPAGHVLCFHFIGLRIVWGENRAGKIGPKARIPRRV